MIIEHEAPTTAKETYKSAEKRELSELPESTTRGKLTQMKDPFGLNRGIERTVFIPDMHVPFHDVEAVNTALNFIKDIKPDRVVLMGDFVDGIALSKFQKDPRFTVTFQQELEAGRNMLDRIRESAGKKAEIHYIEGNHEQRLLNYVLRQAPELVHLVDGQEDLLSIPRLLRLKERNINYIPAQDYLKLHGWNFEHGDAVSSHAGMTANKMITKRRNSEGIGHTHRAGMTAYTGSNGTDIGVEFGCLIDRKGWAASYGKDLNWQTALGVGEYHRGSRIFQVTPIIMQDKSFHYQCKLYTPKGVSR